MKRPTTTNRKHRAYADIERRSLDDLAARTIADPHAPPEHVDRATARLEGQVPIIDVEAVRDRLQALRPEDWARVRDAWPLLRGLLGLADR